MLGIKKKDILIKFIIIFTAMFLTVISTSENVNAIYVLSGDNPVSEQDISTAQIAINQLAWNVGTDKIMLTLPDYEGYTWTVRKDIGEYVGIALLWEQQYDGVGGKTLEMDITNPRGVGFYILFSNDNTSTVIAEETYIYYPDSGVVSYLAPQDRVYVSIDIETYEMNGSIIINQFYNADKKKINPDNPRITGFLEINPAIDIAGMKDSMNSPADNLSRSSDNISGSSGNSSNSAITNDKVNSQNNQINFSDFTSAHWAHQTIYDLANLGYIKGYPDRTFHPDGNITRAEFSAILSAIVKDKWPQGAQNNGPAIFTDLQSNHWAFDITNRLLTYMTRDDVINIFGDKFQADKNISREEVAAVAYSVLKNNGKLPGGSLQPVFTDISKSKFIDSIAFCENNGFINGYPDKTFKPKRNITRAEITSILIKVANQL